MQTRSRMFDDLARLTNGAASVLGGFRDEAEGKVRQQLERLLADMDVVPREEFEAVREMAANARREQEMLAQRVEALEAQFAALTADDKPKRASRRRSAAAGPGGDAAAGDAGDEAGDTTG